MQPERGVSAHTYGPNSAIGGIYRQLTPLMHKNGRLHLRLTMVEFDVGVQRRLVIPTGYLKIHHFLGHLPQLVVNWDQFGFPDITLNLS